VEYKNLFRKLEKNLALIQGAGDVQATLSAILNRLMQDLTQDLGLLRGRIYVRRGDAFVLVEEFPAPREHVGYRIPVTYEPIRQLLRDGFVVHGSGDPELDSEIEGSLGVRTFAAICVGESRERIVAFSLLDSSDREHVVSVLNTIRHVINLTLRRERLEDRVAQARSIQLSLLPSPGPSFADFDIWGSTLPAEEVGGDLYDFIAVSERSLGVAIADSAGHGLPAALQARDAIIGLRMGVEERWRITATVEKLNKVVGSAALVSRFISLFYCEIEPNGMLVYCNAGHNPPLIYHRGVFSELTRGGLILGPNPDARYERGYETLHPGSLLFAYTDGITEAEDAQGEMFGVERIRGIIAGRQWTSAKALVEAVFDAAKEFSSRGIPVDDQTALSVIRPA
jgi:serine phosphatase RsbU (regulator of sigma subunit)